MFPVSNVANLLLDFSFREKKLITPRRLNQLLFLTAVEFEKMGGERLFSEEFCWTPLGPVLLSIESYFWGCHKIRKPMKCWRGNTPPQDNDVRLKIAATTVWEITRPYSDSKLADFIRYPGGAWDSAGKSKKLFLTGLRGDSSFRRIPLK